MSRRSSHDQSQYKYDQNHVKYVPIDSSTNYQNPQRHYKKISASNTRSAYKNPDAALTNYQTYFVPVTDCDSIETGKVKQQSIYAHYSYSSNSLHPSYVQDSGKVNAGRNKVIYLKYPDDGIELKDSKYYSQSNYLLREQGNFYEYDIMPASPDYSYFASDDKSIYKNPAAQLPKIVYSNYTPDIDIKYATNPNFYYPYSSEPSICSQRNIDDIMDYPINNYNYDEELEKISASKSQELLPDMIKRKSIHNKVNENNIHVDDFYATPFDETPTKQRCMVNANTQTSSHAVTKENISNINKIYATTLLSNECTQTDHEDSKISFSKETQTLSCFGNNYFGGIMNTLAKKAFFIYSFYLRTTVIRWLRRILIELAWSVYNCPSNCPMQDRIISSYLNHIERATSLEINECQNPSSPPSRRSYRVQQTIN